MKATTANRILQLAETLSLVGLAMFVLSGVAYLIEPLRPCFAFPLIIGICFTLFWATVNSISIVGELDDPYLIKCNQRSGPLRLPSKILLISDQWDLDGSIRIDLQEGDYIASATVSNGFVTRIRIHREGESGQARTKHAMVSVDSGHLTFADSSILDRIDPKVIEKRIQTVLSSKELLTLFLKDDEGTPLGFVVSTGMGDGQYELRTNADSPATHVACTFN